MCLSRASVCPFLLRHKDPVLTRPIYGIVKPCFPCSLYYVMSRFFLLLQDKKQLQLCLAIRVYSVLSCFLLEWACSSIILAEIKYSLAGKRPQWNLEQNTMESSKIFRKIRHSVGLGTSKSHMSSYLAVLGAFELRTLPGAWRFGGFLTEAST